MSDAIKIGDLVQVVRAMPCCGETKLTKLGFVFIVQSLGKTRTRTTCVNCGHQYAPGVPYAVAEDGNGSLTEILKKIDPPEQGDDLPTRADLPEDIAA